MPVNNFQQFITLKLHGTQALSVRGSRSYSLIGMAIGGSRIFLRGANSQNGCANLLKMKEFGP